MSIAPAARLGPGPSRPSEAGRHGPGGISGRRVLPVAISAVVLGAAGGLASVGWASPGARTFIAIYPPWWTQAQIWTAALAVGEVADVGGSRFVLVIHSREPNAPGRAMRSGAVFTLDPGALGPCGATIKDTPR